MDVLFSRFLDKGSGPWLSILAQLARYKAGVVFGGAR
jgi:hypothetical protein